MGLLRVVVGAAAVCAAAGCGTPAPAEQAAPGPTAGCATTYAVTDVGEPVGPTSSHVEIRELPLDPAEEDRLGKLRLPLSARDHAAALEAAGRVRPALELLCGAGEFGLTAARDAVTGVGYPANDVYVQPFPPSADGATPPGVAYTLHVGDRACVTGHVRPGQVVIDVDGATRDGSCAKVSY
ncbi:hypothetical protein [Saccharothrix luteola]|uniref:hypothetical protein n=1 Tax=Saccharothrix luteola TaxID=2893018 RepID=UPI001E49B22A|nr:hypothetical protein [Saccharothrix luteola]MCC8249444.1 hypothetical protein [Saccharothrix luteola]